MPRPTARPLTVSARRGALGLASVACAATLAGCVMGSSTTTSTLGAATAAPTSSATASLPTGGASLAGRGSDPDAQPVPSGQGVPGSDVADAIRSVVAAKGSVRMQMTTVAGAASAQVDTRTKAMRVQVDAGGGRTVTLVHVGSSTWVKGAGTVTQEAAGFTGATGSAGTTGSRKDVRHWLLLDPTGADDLSRRLGAQAHVASTLDPTRFTGMLDGLLGDKTPHGDGSQIAFTVPATQYLDTVQASGTLRSAVTRPVALVIVLDAAGAPASVSATVHTAKADLVDTTTYSRWGEPVDVQAPDSDDVAPAPGSSSGSSTRTTTPTVSPTDAGETSAGQGSAGADGSSTDASPPTATSTSGTGRHRSR